MRYLDHNATSPLCDSAREAWLAAVECFPGNPSSPHRLGARAERALEEAREALAALLGCPAAALVWTSGATEANNAVLHHVARASDGEVWLSAIEHPSVRAAANRGLGDRLRAIPVTREGVVESGWVADALKRSRPALVGVMAANNETGVLQPWADIHTLCREAGVPFFTDAAQWLGKLPSDGLGTADFVAGCGHKFGGPPGVGFLRCPAGFRPQLLGGPQEDGRRAGTENLPGVLAMLAALRQREAALKKCPAGERAAARDRFEARILAGVPGAAVAGRAAPRLWNTSAVLLPVADCRRRWVVQLDRAGFAVSTGSACASGREKPSHVLAAMGLDGGGERMIRVSSGWETPAADWEALAEAIVAESGSRPLPVEGVTSGS